MTPEESLRRAREIIATMTGDAKHRCFDELVNEIARQSGHGETVKLFEEHAAKTHRKDVSMKTHDELRALAEKATGDEWHYFDGDPKARGSQRAPFVASFANEELNYVAFCADPFSLNAPKPLNNENTRFIAAASPARVLALLDKIERLREALTTIARQKKTHELTDEDYERGCSFEEGYDDIITIARAALEGK